MCYRSVSIWVLPVSNTTAPQSPSPLSPADRGTGRGRINAMHHQALRGLQIALALLLFAAGGGQPIGLGLVAQQVEMIGARQWLGLMAASAMAPVSERI